MIIKKIPHWQKWHSYKAQPWISSFRVLVLHLFQTVAFSFREGGWVENTALQINSYKRVLINFYKWKVSKHVTYVGMLFLLVGITRINFNTDQWSSSYLQEKLKTSKILSRAVKFLLAPSVWHFIMDSGHMMDGKESLLALTL